jgi:hypothetical protein
MFQVWARININDGRDKMSDDELREFIKSAVAGTLPSGDGAEKLVDSTELH